MDYAELEIGLHRHQAELASYEMDLRFSNPSSEVEVAPVRGTLTLDPQELLTRHVSPQDYGQALASHLFADPAVAAHYVKVKTAVENSEQPLRVKLFIGPSAPELHALRWELLTDPHTHTPLATSEKILLSRFGTSQNWRTVHLRPKTELRALVAVSAPSNLDEYELAAVDIDGEIERAREHLQGVQVTVAGKDSPLTLSNLIDALRTETDILYLVCHGALLPKGAHLWLQNDAGQVKVTRGDELAVRLSELPDPPRLVVLASCESAGSENAAASDKVRAGELATLAPLLAESGVPAVLAMQGKISMETVRQAMPVFFSELLKDGQIDRALAVARGNVRDRPDSWMPALFLRLKGGKIWYEPGFGEGEGDFAKWQAIVHAVRGGQFTPIIGPGLGERVYGSYHDIAQDLSEEAGFPLAEHLRTELPQVSQYLRVSQSNMFARDKVKEQLHKQIVRRHKDSLPEDVKTASLPKLLRTVGKMHGKDPADPYALLARLPARLIITANPDNLLQEALKEAQKEPEVFFFNWRKKTEESEKYTEDPTPDKPLIYHILGYFRDDDSLVLTEDDYFDYLIGMTQYKPRIPKVIPYATANTSLLFLGFQLTDWSFRVLFRLIMSQEGGARRKEFAHVAVQVDPEDHALIDPLMARKYLQEYFGESDITIFWGSAGEFLQELENRLTSIKEEAPPAVIDAEDDW